MEIERKWMVTGWPAGLEQTEVYKMDQGYISVRPTVRIRREALQGGPTALVLCFKGEGGLSREEIETEIDAALFARLEHLIGKPLIHKERRGYQLPGGLTLEVNCGTGPYVPSKYVGVLMWYFIDPLFAGQGKDVVFWHSFALFCSGIFTADRILLSFPSHTGDPTGLVGIGGWHSLRFCSSCPGSLAAAKKSDRTGRIIPAFFGSSLL